MSHQMNYRACPLCKKPGGAAAANASPTRLCEPCQTMLRAILPARANFRAGLNAPAPLVEASPSPAPAPFARAEKNGFDGEADLPVGIETENPFRESFDPFPSGPPSEFLTDYRQPDAPKSPYDTSDLTPGLPPEDAPLGAASGYEETSAPDDETGRAEEPGALVAAPRTAPLLDTRADAEAGYGGEDGVEAAARERPPDDPWEEPLPAWETSANEWRGGLRDDRPQPRRAPLALAGLLALAVLGVAGYFFLVKPFTTSGGDQMTEARTGAAPSPPPEVVVPAPAQEQPPAPATPPAGQERAPASPTPATTPAADGPAPTHALQAAASPSRSEAGEYAERLVRAGIPAYVVAADLGKKGVWYRVRIGKFNSEDEAVRYMETARSRARAAGLNLRDLKVYPYEKN